MPVQTSDGYQFATVQPVLVDEKVSVFDGIVVQTAAGTRFVGFCLGFIDLL